MNLNRPIGDGVVTGHGKISGRQVILIAQEPSIFGGSMGEMHARRIASAVDLANRTMRPIVAIWDGTGQRVEDGVPALGATGEVLDSLASCSGRIPVVSVIIGTVAGTSALAAGLSDFVILESERGRMFMRSPWLIPEIASGEFEESDLGGARPTPAGVELRAWWLRMSSMHLNWPITYSPISLTTQIRYHPGLARQMIP